MKHPKKVVLIAGSVLIVSAAVLITSIISNHKNGPFTFSSAILSDMSKEGFISIGLTNKSNWKAHYYITALEIETNGVWYPTDSFRFPAGNGMQDLDAGSSTNFVIKAPLTQGNSRLPVMWGYDYTPPKSMWQNVKEDYKAWLRTGNFRGIGALYTNYFTEIKF